MQFDDFDKKIKEAAEHHHPAYEEKAWDKMEKLLDKHLPVEKDDNRRVIFLLLFLLLTGIGAYLVIHKPWLSKKALAEKVSVSVKQKTVEPSSSAVAPKDAPKIEEGKTGISSPKTSKAEEYNTTQLNPEKETTGNLKVKTGTIQRNIPASFSPLKESDIVSISPGRTKVKKIKPSTDAESKTGNNSIVKSAGTGTVNTLNNPDKIKEENSSISQPGISNDNSANSNRVINPPVVVKQDTLSSKQKVSDVAKTEIEKKTEEPAKKDKPVAGKQKKSAFAITFTAGPDLSAVGISDAGKVKLTYGAGLSYSINRFTVRSGFYFAKKVYTAGPDDYHPPKHYWTYYVDLTKVDADCRLYEIPLTVSYNFSEAKTHNWFAAAGLSTFLMKEEKYGYYYKSTTTGMPGYKDWTLKNGENHIFSILDLSAGYERKLNKTLSIIAEPYFKIPLDGIGFGNIRLNSAGILFTLSVKPFAAKK